LFSANVNRRLLVVALALATLVCALGVGRAAASGSAANARLGPATGPGARRRGTAATRAQHPATADAPDYVLGEVLVGYAPTPVASAASHAITRMGVRQAPGGAPASTGERVLKLPAGESVPTAIARLRRQHGVLYAVPDYVAHQADGWIPNDPGNTHHAGGWQALQWNFLPGVGVDAPDAWANLRADHRPGGRGVVVAILDTGVAYRDWKQFRKSPDFAGTRFVDPYDFVANDPYPLDREGHGTFVAGMVAEATNNGIGLTGLAYHATIMPVRVLDANGDGDSVTIGRGIRYAVMHGAQVINLSLEFDISVTASEIPDIISAINFAHRHGVVVVAAAGNDSATRLAYPARAPAVISVGATTRDRCLAGYSNGGTRLDLVAPGGGDDASLPADPDCHPFSNLPSVHQMTFRDFDSLTPGADPARFGLPGSYGTSMAAPEVSATAALVIASGVLGRHPSPAQVLARLEHTAVPLPAGGARPNDYYGWGLLDAAAATARTPPTSVPTPPTTAG
jgi:serine protease